MGNLHHLQNNLFSNDHGKDMHIAEILCVSLYSPQALQLVEELRNIEHCFQEGLVEEERKFAVCCVCMGVM